MSISAQARTSRIDDEASRLFRESLRVNSQLAVVVGEANAFAAFMFTNPEREFVSADTAKYISEFSAVLTALQTTMNGLTAMGAVATSAITPEQFLAQYVGDVSEYSTRFDKG